MIPAMIIDLGILLSAAAAAAFTFNFIRPPRHLVKRQDGRWEFESKPRHPGSVCTAVMALGWAVAGAAYKGWLGELRPAAERMGERKLFAAILVLGMLASGVTIVIVLNSRGQGYAPTIRRRT